MAKVRKVGRVTFRELTNEEALARYGSSFVFVGPERKRQEQEPLAKPQANATYAPADPILEQLHKMGMEITRKNYLLLMYGSQPTEPLNAEAEASLPAFLRTTL
jgi:hypothetical protein